jgi:hypothetical protein
MHDVTLDVSSAANRAILRTSAAASPSVATPKAITRKLTTNTM